MEIFLLDSLNRPVDIVDTFVSMIWTERYSTLGDFELVTLATIPNIQRFSVGTWLTINTSKKVMRIESAEITFDPDKGTVLKIKGRDILSILESRAALKAIVGGVAPVWYITGKSPGDTMRYMFNQICVVGTLTTDDIIPFYTTGTLYPADTIVEPSDFINWEQKPASVYAAAKEIGDVYDLGMRLYKDPNTANLYFNVYAGSDRTTAQTALPPVIFSTDMENLQNTTEYNSIAQSFNTIHVVYTYHDTVTDTDVAQTVVVYDDTAPASEGFARLAKVLVITNIPEEVTDIPAFLTRAGKDELAKSRPIGAFDGEISQYSSYVYEQDYYLGDLVEMRSMSGATSYMRVEEHISVQDDHGERSYPTLVTKKFIDAGSWFSWKYDIEWSAVADDQFWSNQ